MTGGPDPAALNRAVRLRIRREVAAAMLWALGGGGACRAQLVDALSDALLGQWVAVPARVTAVDDHPLRGSPYLAVDYLGWGTARQATIDHDSDTRYFVGEVLTAYYDPADPGRARTDGDRNDGFALALLRGVTLCSLCCLPWAVVFPVLLALRHRAARRSAWEPVEVTAFSDGSLLLAGRERTATGTSTVTRRCCPYLEGKPSRGWVAGEGRRLVLVIPRGTGPFRDPASPPQTPATENPRGTARWSPKTSPRDGRAPNGIATKPAGNAPNGDPPTPRGGIARCASGSGARPPRRRRGS
ncbi:DUF3592 domain-containing protein [Amycolatopsis sp. NPDC049253]|uniref:DUF3592 domain-containing protein n=1 Tax=Amycolatopsis sp. NPDC049253 TaxID=3155274 RepID=UPI003440DA13